MSFSLPKVDQRIPGLFCPGELVAKVPAMDDLRGHHMYAFRIGDEWITAIFEPKNKAFTWRAMRAGIVGSGGKSGLVAYLAGLREKVAA
ncbi:hypothetical protein EHF33_20580 (plasmid) [Deinococcus psychrotolerans]|uniref:Uncharacterized protein n=1 Tax=Deinococcus psychrotolerans TaxID=2489213 RepID=A0A3G8YJ65_9DEIO|nr:hypothetical protein [Deinococcus psychrotolerans]AZI45308.1 hypothetical protein EHF33_20580 [Deinococcus psychrotolerans]